MCTVGWHQTSPPRLLRRASIVLLGAGSAIHTRTATSPSVRERAYNHFPTRSTSLATKSRSPRSSAMPCRQPSQPVWRITSSVQCTRLRRPTGAKHAPLPSPGLRSRLYLIVRSNYNRLSHALTTWTGSLHQTFRLLPVHAQSPNLLPFLDSEGLTGDQVLNKLPYDVARARSRGATERRPDPRRYRDGRHVYQTAGLLYEAADGRVRLTDLGHATRRWLPILTPSNSQLLARHAAYALSACQLRNPTRAGTRFDPSVRVFPFQFIWRAMLALDGRISSDELNQAIFRVRDEDGLMNAISRIRAARREPNLTSLGPDVITGPAKNDRIIPWLSLASFGWTLFPDKRSGDTSGYYEIPASTHYIIREAARIRHRHRSFRTPEEYVMYISRSAALPMDLR